MPMKRSLAAAAWTEVAEEGVIEPTHTLRKAVRLFLARMKAHAWLKWT